MLQAFPAAEGLALTPWYIATLHQIQAAVCRRMYENAFTHVTDWNIAGQALAEQTSGHAVDCIARLPTARTDGLRRGGSTSSASLLCPKIFFAVTWEVAEPRTSARAGSCSETLVKLADQERQEGTFTAIGLINILIQRGSTAVINVAVSPGATT